MALYHFTLKTDKRPGGNGSRVAAISHVEYINREGAFAKIDEKDASMMSNLITTETKKDALNGKRAILYMSTFGNITNTEDGLLIENQPTLDTLTIALMVAHETMHAPLTLKGSDYFKRKCVMAAAIADLPISFSDKQLQDRLDWKRKDLDDEQRRYQTDGGRIIYKTPDSVPKSNALGISRTILKAPTTGTLPSLHELSERRLAPDGQSQPNVLVQAHDDDELVNTGTTSAPPVRRDFSRGRRGRADLTAKAIIRNIEKNMDAVYAESHVEYINREKAFAQKGGCVYTAHRLPAWADDSPNKFFKAADRYSPKDARRYQEIEFSLQNELTLEQNLEIINEFIKTNMPDHYYAYAVHDKIGTMSDGSHNLHVHLMFSPRIIDDIEKKRERQVSKYFKYPLRKNAKDQSEKNRRNAGAPMDRRFSDPAFVREMRKSYQDITNATLKKYGRNARIDHRSLKAQKMEAEANGDVFLAKLLDRIPEEHISRYGMLDEKNPDVTAIKNYRQKKKEYQDLLFSYLSIEREKEEQEEYESSKKLREQIKKILSSNEFLDSDNDATSYIGELRIEFLSALKHYDSLKSQYETKEELLERAKIEYMTPEEREQYQSYKETLEEMDHWMTFSENLQKPETNDEGELAAYEQLLPALAEKLQTLDERRIAQKTQVDEINLRLEQTDIKKQIQLIVARSMRENRHEWESLKQAEQNLEVSAKSLEQALFQSEQTETGLREYHTRELYQIIRRRFYGYRKEVERLKKQVSLAKKNVISMDRATKMAEDVYTKGAFKKLREELRKLKKQEGYLENDKKKLQEAIAQNGLLDEYVVAQTNIAKRETELSAARMNLEKTQQQLQSRIETPKAQDAIQSIALGIMRKNSGYAKRYESLKEHLVKATEKMTGAQNEMNALKEALTKDKANKNVYRVDKKALRASGGPPPSAGGSPSSAGTSRSGQVDEPSAIAQALLKAGNFATFVARATNGDDDNGLKNWKLMSEIEKIEEEEKRLYNNI